MLLLACTTDAYDKGEGDYSLMTAEMTDITVGDKCQALSATTDADDQLLFTQPWTTSWFVTPDSVYRTVLYYKKVENNTVEALGASNVSVLRPHVIKDMKTDPVQFESAWLSSNRRYLNASIYVMLGDTSNELLKHTIGMNVDTLEAHENGTSTLHLTLYHDQGGMPEYFSQRAYLSVPLDSLDVDSVSLSIHTYDAVVVKQFGLR